jgi:chromosome segregation ATPase
LFTVCVVEVLTFVFDRLDEVHTLQEAVDRFTVEKREIEKQLAAQEENCRQLTQANNTLSARALTLADEAATAPEKVRKELMAQLTECRASLKEAQEELDAVRRSDQSQTEALLDELNSLQTDNGNLRAQLRAVKK